MYYEINVSLNGRHLFATAERSITDKSKLKQVLEVFKEKFPESEGYKLNEEKMWFEIKEDGEVIKATMKDEQIIDVPDTEKNKDYINVLNYTKDLPITNYMLAVDYDSLENYKEAFKYYNQFISTYTTDDEYLKYAKDRMEELRQYAG